MFIYASFQDKECLQMVTCGSCIPIQSTHSPTAVQKPLFKINDNLLQAVIKFLAANKISSAARSIPMGNWHHMPAP